MHEVDVFGQRLSQRLGHRLDPAVRDQTPPDLGLDLLAELIDAVLVLIGLETLLQRGERLGRLLAGGLHQLFHHRVEVEVPQRAVQVVGAAHRAPRLHPGVPTHAWRAEARIMA